MRAEGFVDHCRGAWPAGRVERRFVQRGEDALKRVQFTLDHIFNGGCFAGPTAVVSRETLSVAAGIPGREPARPYRHSRVRLCRCHTQGKLSPTPAPPLFWGEDNRIAGFRASRILGRRDKVAARPPRGASVRDATPRRYSMPSRIPLSLLYRSYRGSDRPSSLIFEATWNCGWSHPPLAGRFTVRRGAPVGRFQPDRECTHGPPISGGAAPTVPRSPPDAPICSARPGSKVCSGPRKDRQALARHQYAPASPTRGAGAVGRFPTPPPHVRVSAVNRTRRNRFRQRRTVRETRRKAVRQHAELHPAVAGIPPPSRMPAGNLRPYVS